MAGLETDDEALWCALDAAQDDAVLQAALAFVDESDGRRRDSPSLELQQLRSLARELSLQLDDLRSRRCDECRAPLNALWAPVAASQSSERQRVEAENAQLRLEIAKQQRTVRAIASKVDALLRRYRQPRPESIEPVRPPLRVNIHAQYLCERLDALYMSACADETHEMPGEVIKVYDGSTYTNQCFERTPQGGVIVRSRSQRRWPFKLSAVVNEAWEMTIQQSIRERCDLVADFGTDSNLYSAALTARRVVDAGSYEASGGVVLRRVFEPNGDVLVLACSFALPCGSSANLMEGFALIEEGWSRMKSCRLSSGRQIVAVEEANLLEIVPLPDPKRLTRGDHETPRLETFASAVVDLMHREAKRHSQRLENRLLDASLRPRLQ